MKLLLLSLAGTLIFGAGITTGSTRFNTIEPVTVECTECTKKFESCTKPVYDAYATAVEKAADKLKAGAISKQEYQKVCDAEGKIMDKADAVCMSEFQKCCLAETKKNMEAEKSKE